MSGWQIGDVARCISDDPLCNDCEPGVPVGTGFAGDVRTISDVSFRDGDEYPCLDFEEEPYDPEWVYCACTWRIIDKHEPCEAEFVTLLKRTKRPVSA